MSLDWLEVLSVLLVPLALGAACLRFQGIVPRTDRLAYLGWAWLEGSVALAAVLSLWLWLELPLAALWLAPTVLLLAGLGFAFARRVPALEPSAPNAAPAWERALFALVVAALLVTTVDRILLASADILVGSDEARIWAAKAKILFNAGGFGPEFRAAMGTPEVIAHPDYPPLNPLLEMWVHAHAGSIVHVESRLPIQAFALAGVLVAASALRRRARPLVAALFLVCIGTIGRFFTYQVFSDALIAIGLLACWDFWQRYEEDGELAWLRALGCTAPLLVWSKNEGSLQVLAFGLALLLALALRRARLPGPAERRRVLVWTLPLVLSIVYLRWFNAHFDLVNDLIQGSAEAPDSTGGSNGPGFLELARENAEGNVRPIVTTFANLIAETQQTHCLTLLFLVLAVLGARRAFGPGRAVFTLGLLVALLGYMAVYLGTHWEVEVHLKHSAHRLVYQLTPSAGLWVLLFVVEVLPRFAACERSAG